MLFRSIYARHQKDFTWRATSIDRLAGTDRLRAAVENDTVDALLREWDADAKRFTTQVKPYLLYR